MDESATTTVRDDLITFLVTHDTTTTPHIFGDLHAHLLGVETLVRKWGGPDRLALAALAHATYGTDGFEPSLLAINEREILQEVVGSEIEGFVYFYAACDRAFFYPELGRAADKVRDGESAQPRYRDRFTGEESTPNPQTVRYFCDLTFANEVELAASSPGGPKEWTWLADFCRASSPLADQGFWLGAADVLGVEE
jgi:hypothetical protein